MTWGQESQPTMKEQGKMRGQDFDVDFQVECRLHPQKLE